MKVCRTCSAEKPLTEFYKHSGMADGHLNKCNLCVKARIKKYRELNFEKIQAHDKLRNTEPHRVKARKEYLQTEAGRLSRKKSIDAYHKRYPMTYAAHVITGNAIRDGKLFQASNCSVCDSTEKIEGHHDDYTKPLEIRWLCKKCHKEWHKHNKPIYE